VEKNILPGWFCADSYKPLKDERSWLNAIVDRLWLRQLMTVDKKKAKELFQLWVIEGQPENFSGQLEKEPFELLDIWPVREMNCLEVALLNKYMRGDAAIKELEDQLYLRVNNPEAFFDKEPSQSIKEGEGLKKSVVSAVADADEILNMRSEGMFYPIGIDISQDDETLKLAFEIWLRRIREAWTRQGVKAPKKKIGSKEFADWHTWSILPCFDLTLWSEMNEIYYTDPYLSDLLWPENNAPFDRVGRLRRTTRKLVNEVIHWNVVDRLKFQIKFGALVEKKKQEKLASK